MLLSAMLLTYAAGAILPLCAPGRPRAQNFISHGLAIIACGIGMTLGVMGIVAQEPLVATLPSSIPLLEFSVRLDPLAGFFVFTISLIGLAVSIYALGYVQEYYGRISIGLLGFLYNGFLLAMTLVVLADNAFFFLIAWELMSLISYFLVVSEHEKVDVRFAGMFYLIMTHVGTAFIIVTFLIFYQAEGSFAFEAFRMQGHPLPEGMRSLVFWAALIGFGTKAGIIPLHVWLPYAHPAAPSHVSALMSGVMIKTAIYGLIRVYFDFLDGSLPWWWGFTVLVIGTISALLGVMYALMEHDLKSLLAFHSVENIGIILMGLGAGMLFHSYGMESLAVLGVVAGLYHTLNHATFKALLFMGAGSLLYATHTRNMEEYGGLLKLMPWTGLFFLIGAVSISGLPPTNGFVSEWLVFQSLFLSLKEPSIFVELMLPIAAAMLAFTSVLALSCFAKAFAISFLAQPRSSHARHAQEVPLAMRVGMGMLAGMCVVLGLAPMVVIPLLDRVTFPFLGSSIAGKVLELGGWALAPVSPEFSSVSTPLLFLLLGGLMGLGLILCRVIGGKLRSRSYITWGCGQKVNSRMEYTATGFVQPIKQVFSALYQPTEKVETAFLEESRYFAKYRHFDYYIEPIFMKYLYNPVVKFFSTLAEHFRVIQSGSLSLYLAYIFITLILLLLFAV